MPTYSIGLCLTPWTSHTDTVYDDTSRAAHSMPPPPPPYSPACSLLLIFCLCDAPPPVRTADGPYRHTTALAHYPRVPFPALMTTTSPAAVLLASRAEVRWLGYVDGAGITPLVCLRGQGMPQYSL